MRMGQPQGHGKASTFVTGLEQTSRFALFVLDGSINRLAIEA